MQASHWISYYDMQLIAWDVPLMGRLHSAKILFAMINDDSLIADTHHDDDEVDADRLNVMLNTAQWATPMSTWLMAQTGI